MQRLMHTFAFISGKQARQNYLVCKTKHVHTFIQSQGLTDIWHAQFKGTIWTVHLTTEDEAVVL